MYRAGPVFREMTYFLKWQGYYRIRRYRYIFTRSPGSVRIRMRLAAVILHLRAFPYTTDRCGMHCMAFAALGY